MNTEIVSVRWHGTNTVTDAAPWNPQEWYLVPDDHPYLDILTRGNHAQIAGKNPDKKLLTTLKGEDTVVQDQPARWQRWNFEADLGYKRRFGRISLRLKVPKDCVLQAYVIPAKLLNFRDIEIMIGDIREMLGIDVSWERGPGDRGKAWARTAHGTRSATSHDLIDHVGQELKAARSIRQTPFTELTSPTATQFMLVENALVSHWAVRRSTLISKRISKIKNEIAVYENINSRGSPNGRRERTNQAIDTLRKHESELKNLRLRLRHLIAPRELNIAIYSSPLLQRDYRLRLLLRAFGTTGSQAYSDTEAQLSHYPPVVLNDLWELWGAVWLVRELEKLGFSGTWSHRGVDTVVSCCWRLNKGEISLDLDYEARPALVDHDRLPPISERNVPTMEWAALNQHFDEECPYLGLEARCSPDYLIRISCPGQKILIVGDACLASPEHHAKMSECVDNNLSNDEIAPSKAKPLTVEHYRRTIAWIDRHEVVRCHPLGGFVLFPPTAEKWSAFAKLPGASDCTLLCPRPGVDPEASGRFKHFLSSIVPGLLD
ncbi:hypothetical protein [Acetobacter fabarum]|uniref:hypothetical protein n=1 Tax=Acetobacter fabarum TaxID=483199 RepID=UPI0039EAC681